MSSPAGILGYATSGLLLFLALFISLVLTAPSVSDISLEHASLEERTPPKRVEMPTLQEVMDKISDFPPNQALFFSFHRLDEGDYRTVEAFGRGQKPILLTMEDLYGSTYRDPDLLPMKDFLLEDEENKNKNKQDEFLGLCLKAIAIKVAQEHTFTTVILPKRGFDPQSDFARYELD